MQFGKLQTTEIIDAEGSTKTEDNTYRAGVVGTPKRLHYQIRHRTNLTDLEALTNIAKALLDDSTKLDVSLKLERTTIGNREGTYHIVECYTILEY